MGIFTRVRDIINSMLDKAEDPEKLIRLMIQEMEDTLVEIRASCADVMAAAKKVQRAREGCRSKAEQWAQRAQLAIGKGREDLAREALLEKRRYYERADSLEKETQASASIVEQYQADITQLEEKLSAAREKQRILVQRHAHAQKKKRAQMDIRRMETSDAFIRFEQFENRIERMEAEADLVNFGRKSSLESQFDDLEGGEEIEKELQDLKDAANKSPETPAQGETGSPEAPSAS
jgi:phage shock protein A